MLFSSRHPILRSEEAGIFRSTLLEYINYTHFLEASQEYRRHQAPIDGIQLMMSYGFSKLNDLGFVLHDSTSIASPPDLLHTLSAIFALPPSRYMTRL